MMNNSDFSKRLKIILEYYQMSAALFADKIGVQPSSISHLLSGRNKPSLDFVLKVVKHFKEIELYWLLNGKGSFPNTVKIEPSTPFKAEKLDAGKTKKKSLKFPTIKDDKEIERIVIFYTDGSFKDYLK